MSTAPGRSNGLSAASYVALVDLVPPLADALLDLLRVEAIAAYAAPATDRPVAEIPIRTPATRPVDRVFVDRAASARARVLLDDYLPQLTGGSTSSPSGASPPPPPTDGAGGATGPTGSAGPDDSARIPTPDSVDDDVWAGIVASYEMSDQPAPGTRTWPEGENLPDGENPPTAENRPDGENLPEGTAGTRVVRASSFESLRPAFDTPREARPEPRADEDHYEPPTPPPLPTLDPVGKAAWLGALGAPVLLVVLVLLQIDVGGWTGVGLIAAFIAGFVTLVVRMKDSREDDWDDGAVV